MIKFFRKIRQRLLVENKVSKYFLYAIGEIVLVVVGILIALQINNWNELQKESLKEYQILISLQKDFRSNKSNLDSTIVLVSQMMDSLVENIYYFGEDELPLSKQLRHTIYAPNYIVTNLVDGSLTSVLSSDKLELIRNDSLKYRLTAYPSAVKKYQKQETLLENYVLDKQRPILRKYTTLLDLPEIPLEDSPQFDQLKRRVGESDYRGLLNDREYQNTIIGMIVQNSILRNYAAELMQETKVIIALLEESVTDNPNYVKI